MIELSLEEIATAAAGDAVALPQLRVDAVGTDSRTLGPGSLFVALRGDVGDGHDWVRAAVEAGAAAVVVEQDVDVPDRVGVVRVADCWQALLRLGGHVREIVDPAVIAVTGSVGKTTTKDLVAAAAGPARRTVAATGSFNNELGVPLTLLALEADTEVLVTEIGARRTGDIANLAAVASPDVAIVTAVAPVHLELFETIEAVAATKGELVASLGADGTAVLNADDQRVMAMGATTGAQVLLYGESASADVHLREIVLDERARPRSRVATPWGEVELVVPVAGRHNAWNGAAAIAAAGVIGIDPAVAADGIAGATVSSWRGEVIDVGAVRFLNDAYNANPVAMRAALETLDELAAHRRVAVLGVMAEIGAAHDEEHHGIGAMVPKCADVLVVVGDEAIQLAVGAEDAGMNPGDIHEVADAEAAQAILRRLLEPGDTVLVKASRVAGLEQVVEGWMAQGGDAA